ncbi:glutamate-1-semialdehyde 2,1-aminomutase [Acidovorax soli]|uniref:Glutamate-1-semialdehyde 2,1-aminomutase n=1 Tax=Acidovorax soli TaxID=592050 RepID=A0A7X0PD70_9BURK|nr:aminotransferase class III-fold pyridoxal phosphate-dependent enzyme [Acidovorax soli]MBB6559371.1 glutamate-1-semialdehyde 2,1-aminomutase [Acidovorax soli]
MNATPTPLDQALFRAVENYRARNPRSAALLAEAEQSLPGGNTRSVLFHGPFPLSMARGEGCRVWDADGHAYIDALGEFTAGLYGHSHPVILAAIQEALAGGINLSSHTAREARLAQEIRRRFPSMELLRFANSGTEANLLALAAAKAHTGRSKVIVFDGAYHGGVLTFAGGGSPMNVPHAFVLARYNDVDSVRTLVAEHGPDIAAILVEPMLGAGGCIPGEPGFLQALRTLADECGAMLVFDEVMTSRLSFGGRQALLSIRPDLTTAGKYLGGGMSFGVFGGRRDVMERFDPRRPDALAHAGTFNNNVLSMAAGHAGLSQVLTAEVVQALNARGEQLRERFNAVFAQHGVDMGFTGIGSLMTLHATAGPVRSPADLQGTDGRAKDLLFFGLLEEGVFMARRGLIALSLPVGDAECDALVAALDAVVARHRAVLPQRA